MLKARSTSISDLWPASASQVTVTGNPLDPLRGGGWEYLHIAFAASLPGQTQQSLSASSSSSPARAFYAHLAFSIRRLLPDNGSCYCRGLFRKLSTIHTLSIASRASTRQRKPSASSKPHSENGPTPAHTGTQTRGGRHLDPFGLFLRCFREEVSRTARSSMVFCDEIVVWCFGFQLKISSFLRFIFLPSLRPTAFIQIERRLRRLSGAACGWESRLVRRTAWRRTASGVRRRGCYWFLKSPQRLRGQSR